MSTPSTFSLVGASTVLHICLCLVLIPAGNKVCNPVIDLGVIGKILPKRLHCRSFLLRLCQRLIGINRRLNVRAVLIHLLHQLIALVLTWTRTSGM